MAVPTALVEPARDPASRPSSRRARSKATEERILATALESFGTHGVDATSLDDLAQDLGMTKQAILYHWPSKRALLDAVIDRACLDLVVALDAALRGADQGWDRIEAVVRAVFRVALRRPELLGLIREVSRLGGEVAARVTTDLAPFVDRARGFVEREMAAGRMRRGDPDLMLLSAYSTVFGVATELEVMRALGVEPTLRTMVVRRRELLAFLRGALGVPDGPD